MSNITTVREVGQLEGGDLIKCMRVTVKTAYPPKKGSNEYGDWSIQPAMVEDETGIIRCSFYDWPNDLRQLQGNTITITAGKDGKGHQAGIEALDYEDKKKNIVVRQVKVTNAATIEETNGGSPGPARNEPSDRPAPPVRQNGNGNYNGGYVDEKGASIEKQVALKCAVKFANVHNQAGLNGSYSAQNVVEFAHLFYDKFFKAQPAQPDPEPQPGKPEQEAPASDEKVI